MSLEKFVAIGHISEDVKPERHLGGAVSYGAVVASRLGWNSYIITKCSSNSDYIGQLIRFGVTPCVLPIRNPEFEDKITTFDNVYDAKGNRSQIVLAIQEPISLKDKENFPQDVLRDSIILAAPITGKEIDMKLFPELAEMGDVYITPQGYFRQIGKGGIVTQKKWSGFEEYLSSTKGVILSDEDITIGGRFDKELRDKIIASTPLVALTQGKEGVTIYADEKEFCHTGTFPLKEEELKDFTGAGDTFATAFILALKKNNRDIKIASVIASFFAAVKINGIGGIGIDSIPTRGQVAGFIEKNQARVSEYLKREGSGSLRILEQI